jgi:hypothetical protein
MLPSPEEVAVMELSAQQLAELLSGIARAQAALVHGIESALPGARNNHLVPAVQVVARLRDRPYPTFGDLPSRILLQYMGRAGVSIEAIAEDLERLARGDAPPAPGQAPIESRPVSPDMSTTLNFVIDSPASAPKEG